MGNIVVLDDLTINKIAAGEVVERPASVIKEMVENSIDAGADNICVEIKNGGISYIRITDNGKGIMPDDVELAFERHATSKIRVADDLDNVKSMGFRGEALASIAAIANVEMMSKVKDLDIGYKVVIEAGNVLEKEEVGCPNGTTITVKNLFFNTPVRYKFLKKDYTESGYIEDVITRLALVNPNISFKLISSGKTIIQTSGNGKLQDVIYNIYGKDIANSILKVDYKYEDIHITGVVGKPEIARSNRTNQLFFVNKRYIKDKTLSGASEQAFKGLLPIGKYGFLILNIDMDPSKVDVNVHPAKLEVRFQEENKIFKSVYHSIKETLLKSELIENTSKETSYENKMSKETIENVQSTNSFTDLFRKISNNVPSNKDEQENKELMQNNIIANIYEKKEETKNISPNKIPKLEVFDELIKMQKKLQKEVETNPSLEMNLEKIKINTQKIEDAISSGYKHQEVKIQQNDIIEGIKTSDKLEQEQTNDVKEVLDKQLEDMQVIPIIKQEKVTNDIKDELIKNRQSSKIDSKEILDEQLEDIQIDPIIEEEKVTNDIENELIKNEQSSKIDSKEMIDGQLEDRQINTVIEQEKVTNDNNMQKTNQNKLQNSQEQFESIYESIFGKPLVSNKEEEKHNNSFDAYEIIKDNNISVFEESDVYGLKPNYKFIGIAFSTYIIIEIEKEMYIIDQHAAHERILYEKVKENFYTEEEKDSQLLLLPDIITLTHKEMDIAKDNMEVFRKAGFVLEEFGENTIKLSGAPNICIDLDTKELFLETLDEINTVARTAKQEIEERFIATVACKAAVKANMALTKQEVESLMEQLLKLPNPFTCPHGRPTAIRMSKTDIEKKFARRK